MTFLKPAVLFLLVLVTSQGLSQILMSKPYVLLTNTTTNEKWKLKKGKSVQFRLKQSKEQYYTEVITGIKPDSIHLYDVGWFHVNDIDYITFKPKSKFRRYVKLAYYGTIIGAAPFIIYYESNPYADPVSVALGLSFLAIIPGELGGLLIQLFSPWREFYTGDGWVLTTKT